MKISPAIAAPVLYTTFNLWFKTLRYDKIGWDNVVQLAAQKQPLVFCLWHDEIFPVWRLSGELKVAAVVSRSNDGELLSRVAQKCGIPTIRGSSSRGGAAALHGAVTAMRKDNLLPCVTVDGPRGPRHMVKDGVFFMAHHGEALLVPLRIFNQKVKRLGSWDKFQLPLPFSRGRLVMGEPYAMQAKDTSKEALKAERAILAAKMEELEKYAFGK